MPADVPGGDAATGRDDAANSAVDAGVDAKTCSQTTCRGGVLEVCGAANLVEHTEQCALGCFFDETRCNQLVASNGLDTALDQAVRQGPITLPAGTVVNTDTGRVFSSDGSPVAAATTTVEQPGGATLRVMLAQSWVINDIRIRGTLPIAFVSSNVLTVQGAMDASADHDTNGPGALVCGSTGGGGAPASDAHFERVPPENSGGYPAFLWITNGFGGGGFGTAGGPGGEAYPALTGAAGAANGNAELVPLRGGCEGGGDVPQHRGAGGGVIQLVSGRAVHLVVLGVSKGVVHVGGGRGVAGTLGHAPSGDTSPLYAAGGGGSGGGLLIEAPSVILDDGTALLAAGGGGGGYGACNPGPDGVDAPPNGAIPSGGDCPPGTTPSAAGGAGAITGAGTAGETVTAGAAGSGGGGLGRIRINTADGQYIASTSSLIRGVTTSGTLAHR
jgi:hypothetical protein